MVSFSRPSLSKPSRSQYVGGDGGGASACGLAALNCARIILGKERDGLKGVALLEEMVKKETLEDILRICFHWSTPAHLDVDDILKAPIFDKTLTPLWSQYNRPRRDQFRALLAFVLNVTPSEEIVCLLKITTETKDVFVLFDSHPRHNHPEGAAFIFHPDLEAAADYLSELFKYDPHLLTDTSLQWQAQLLANYSGYAFTIKSTLSDSVELVDAVLESSLEVLALKAERASLQVAYNDLQSQVDNLSEGNARLEDQVMTLRRAFSTGQQMPSQPSSVFSTVWRSSSSSSFEPIASSSKLPGTSSATTAATSTKPNGKMIMHAVEEKDDDDFVFATRIQLEWQADSEDIGESAHLAAEKQREFEEEDHRLRVQMRDLQATVPATFHCGVCFEEHSEFMIARVDPCGHEFCRDCVRGYIRSKLGEHRFPILCPICSADRDKTDPGIQQIGLTEEEFALFTELEMAAFSILLHCRRQVSSSCIKTNHRVST
ncbi:hypothetical protein EUX98_g8250 [Antrodiella citrinella]|uniref:RING-type domain-containing protein n=1 Tax=Antrodiella citrinella TaxID=2447956 RepID=A0A4S4M9Q1_9APHY|nr:hypothetical protein EUX98_g8250 [Antrodiella citrinella]